MERTPAQQLGIYKPSGLLDPVMSNTQGMTVGDQFELMKRLMPQIQAVDRREMAMRRDQRAEEAQDFQQERYRINDAERAERAAEADIRRQEAESRRIAGVSEELIANGIDHSQFYNEDGQFDDMAAAQELGAAKYKSNLDKTRNKQAQDILKYRQGQMEEFEKRQLSRADREAKFLAAGGSKDSLKNMSDVELIRETGALKYDDGEGAVEAKMFDSMDGDSFEHFLDVNTKQSDEFKMIENPNANTKLKDEQGNLLEPEFIKGDLVSRGFPRGEDLTRTVSDMPREAFISRYLKSMTGDDTSSNKDLLGSIYDRAKSSEAKREEVSKTNNVNRFYSGQFNIK